MNTNGAPRAHDDADISALLGAAAHELANSLNAVSMNAELAKMLLKRGQAEQSSDALERLLAECGRCGRVLRDIRKFASGLKARPRETVHVSALIDAAQKLYRQECSTAKPAIVVEGIDESISVDRMAIERAIAGLLHNATEAGATEIDIRATREADSVLIAVCDNGHGIADEVRPHAADAFFTTRRAAGHIGVGLTLARMWSRAHGGELSIDENREDGTRVVMRLSNKREVG